MTSIIIDCCCSPYLKYSEENIVFGEQLVQYHATIHTFKLTNMATGNTIQHN